VHLGKHFRLVPDGVEVTYRWHNSGEGPCPVTWRVVNELTPAYSNILRTDRSEIHFVEDEERAGVANTAARQGIFVEAAPLPDEVICRDGLLAVEIELGYAFELAAGEQQVVTIRLQRETVQKKKRRRR
jgi:hypothetical protein